MGLYLDETGRLIDVDDRFAAARGYAPAAPEDLGSQIASDADKARGEERGLAGEINAAATGFASSLTLGGSDYLLGESLPPIERERLLAELEAHPNLRTGGEIAGALTGGMAMPGSMAARTPAGYLGSRAAVEMERGLAQGGVKGAARALGSMGVEGAIQNAGQYIGHAALEDKETTVEGFAGSLGTGFAFSAAAGGTMLGVAKGTMAARRMFSRVMDGQRAAQQAESAWTLARQEALDSDAATVRTAEIKLDEIKKAKIDAMRGRNEARAAAREEQVRASTMTERAGPDGETLESQTSSFEPPHGPEPLIDVGPQTGAGGVTSKYQKPEPITFDPSDAKAFDEGMPSMRDQVNEVARKIEKPVDGAKTGKIELPAGSTKKVVKPSPIEPTPAAEMTDLERQLAGTKEAVDAGADLKNIKASNDNTAPQLDTFVDELAQRRVTNQEHAVQDFYRDTRDALKSGAWTRKDVDETLAKIANTRAKLKRARGLEEFDAEEAGRELTWKNVGDLDDALHELSRYEDAVRHAARDNNIPLSGNQMPLPPGADLKNVKAAKGNESPSIERWIAEEHAARAKSRTNETLSEMRYHATSDLLGAPMAKMEREIAEAMDEFTAAQKGLDDLSDGVPLPVDDPGMSMPTGPKPGVTAKGSPRGRRQALEMLDDAHDEALLRGKYAADPKEAGQAIQEASELERLLDDVSDGIPREYASDALGHELVADIEKLWRYEQASAKLADVLGDQAHITSVARAKGLRDAEKDSMRKVMDRSARAVDDAAEFGPTYKTPKERVAYAREQQNTAQKHLDEIGVQEREAADAYGKAGKKLREGERAKKAALRDDAKLAAKAGKFGAQDAGGIMELIDLPGIPKPSDLPVVGPLLGAWLKFRTLKRAMGRMAGRVPATADAMVAARSAQTRDRIARAVDRSLGLAERAGKKVLRKTPAVGGILSHRIFDNGEEDVPKDAPITKHAGARMREIATYVTTPGAIERDVRIAMQGVSDPDLIAAAEAHRRAMFEHLLKNIPPQPDQGLMKTVDWEPSPGQSMSFARRYEALQDPGAVYDRLASTQDMISLEAAEALREVYPKLFNQALQRTIEQIAQNNARVPIRQRVQMSVFYQVPLDAALDPVNFQITQSVYERKPSSPAYNPQVAGVAPQAPTAQPAIANPVNISQEMTTSIDRR